MKFLEILIKMDELIELVWHEKEWRGEELSLLLKIVNDEKNDSNSRILSKYSVPAIYAIWEGFLRESLKHYSSFINRNEYLERNMNMITQIIDHNDLFRKKNLRKFTDRKKLFTEIKNILEHPTFPEERPWSTNLDFLTSNYLLSRFGLKYINKKYRIKLDNLVKARQSVAHGENSILSSKNDVYNYISLIENLMYDVTIIIEKKAEIIGSFK